jgi:hypothetical protein
MILKCFLDTYRVAFPIFERLYTNIFAQFQGVLRRQNSDFNPILAFPEKQFPAITEFPGKCLCKSSLRKEIYS